MAHSSMRITFDLDHILVAALSRRHPSLSKTVAIERAIRAYLERSAAAELISLTGTVEIEDVSHELRRQDHRT